MFSTGTDVWSLPVHTAALTCGVKPTIQASLLPALTSVSPTVPVFAADGRPLASASSDQLATSFMLTETSLATLALKTRLPLFSCL